MLPETCRAERFQIRAAPDESLEINELIASFRLRSLLHAMRNFFSETDGRQTFQKG
jgi:hypothetical protein